MCGIVGYITTDENLFPDARQHFLRYGLIMDTIRGPDSTGIISVYNGTDFDVHASRSLCPGNRFVETKQWNKIKRDGWCTIGHNRAATHGSIKVANAHPFRFGPITLVHNGTLEGQGSSLPSYDKKLEVDSMQIALALSTVEPGEATDILEKINGAFALVWTDSRDKTVNMARNGARPFHFSWNKDKNFMMFMSDGNMLSTMNRSLWRSNAQGQSVYSLDVHKLMKFQYGSLVPEVTRFEAYRKPYIPPKTTQTPRMTGGSGTTGRARDRAADKWNNRQPAGIDKDPKVPRGMLDAMEKYYEADPTMLLRYKPEDTYELYPNTDMVYGQVFLPHWGNTPWDAVIYDVPAAQSTEYLERDWMVRPIGITRPITGEGDSPSLLCQLIHCDWAGYSKTAGGKLAEKMGKLVKDPHGRLIQRTKLEAMVAKGCVLTHCAAKLNMNEIEEYLMVNNDQDLICDKCKWETC